MNQTHQQLEKKSCLITGGTSGIGRSTIHILAKSGYSIVFTGRNEKRGKKLEKTLGKLFPNQSFNFVKSHMDSIHECRQLAGFIKTQFKTLDLLINNAGGRNELYQENADGLELTFAANYLGHFILTVLLLPLLQAAPNSRIIHVSSRVHRMATSDGIWVYDKKSYDGWKAYSKSKLANALFSYELSKRLAHTNVTTNTADPGVAATRFDKNNGIVQWIRKMLIGTVQGYMKRPIEAAQSINYMATSTDLSNVTGKYIKKSKIDTPSPLACDDKLSRSLWDYSIEISQLSEKELTILNTT